MFMIMIMNSNTNNVGGRRFSKGGRNEPLENEGGAGLNHNEVVLCTLKWLTKMSWKWARQAKTLESRLLSLLLVMNISHTESMTLHDLTRFLMTENNADLKICKSITTGMKLILSSLNGM